jgi:hypothetical protein
MQVHVVFIQQKETIKALDYANKALAQAPNEGTKTTINGYISKLKEGKDIN